MPGLPAPVDVLAMTDLEKLNLPAGARRLDAVGITTYEAVRLFIARAVGVRPDFRVTNENAPAVAGIAARLHGMPLAIELAAARVKLLSPDAILERLEHQLGVLAAGSRDLPERQQTLRGAIAWSHDLLDPGERRLLARHGGVRRRLRARQRRGRSAGPPSELDGLDVLDGLMSLADQSLVRVEEIDDATRFRMLDTIREFAAERLTEGGEREEIERRHGATFVALAESLTPLLSGPDQRRWLGRLERDHDNIRAVLDRATAAGDGPHRDPPRVRDVALLAEARPPRRGGSAAAGDGRCAMVPGRSGPSGPAHGGPGRRRLVAGRSRDDGARVRRGARDLGGASATGTRSSTRSTTTRSATP